METASQTRRDVIFGVIKHTCDDKEYPVGMMAFFPKYASDDIVVNGQNLHNISTEDVVMLCQVEKEET